MKRAGVVITIIVAVLALGCGFGSAAAVIGVTQPSVAGSKTVVQFSVESGDSTAAVAQRLQQQGLIRNAQLFRLWARYKHLDTGIEPGVYDLNAGMTMDGIIKKLQKGTPDQILVHLLEGWRVTQYPDAFKGLANFNKDNFLKIARTGNLNDGTPLSKSFWYVLPLQKNAVYALEGYLYPDSYFVDPQATEEDVVKRMLATFGEHLCPGPAGKPDAYLADQAQCKAHAVTVDDQGTTIFAALEKNYDAKDDRHAIYLALTIGSITMREIPNIKATADIQGIASVYYNRWQHASGNTKYPSDTGTLIQADPTVQYALATDKPPTDGKTWWPNVNTFDVHAVSPKNPYNTYVFPGLPPGPIAAPLGTVFAAAANPHAADGKQYYYFLNADCAGHKTYFASNNTDFEKLKAQYLGPNARCS